ncbi:hypothetical protein BC828DRAFT_407981 [Blastocladiella britannica]|nr:hypothetical protein BC828DRAFT_407981 [Blastocladiella britannica]
MTSNSPFNAPPLSADGRDAGFNDVRLAPASYVANGASIPPPLADTQSLKAVFPFLAMSAPGLPISSVCVTRKLDSGTQLAMPCRSPGRQSWNALATAVASGPCRSAAAAVTHASDFVARAAANAQLETCMIQSHPDQFAATAGTLCMPLASSLFAASKTSIFAIPPSQAETTGSSDADADIRPWLEYLLATTNLNMGIPAANVSKLVPVSPPARILGSGTVVPEFGLGVCVPTIPVGLPCVPPSTMTDGSQWDGSLTKGWTVAAPQTRGVPGASANTPAYPKALLSQPPWRSGNASAENLISLNANEYAPSVLLRRQPHGLDTAPWLDDPKVPSGHLTAENMYSLTFCDPATRLTAPTVLNGEQCSVSVQCRDGYCRGRTCSSTRIRPGPAAAYLGNAPDPFPPTVTTAGKLFPAGSQPLDPNGAPIDPSSAQLLNGPSASLVIYLSSGLAIALWLMVVCAGPIFQVYIRMIRYLRGDVTTCTRELSLKPVSGNMLEPIRGPHGRALRRQRSAAIHGGEQVSSDQLPMYQSLSRSDVGGHLHRTPSSASFVGISPPSAPLSHDVPHMPQRALTAPLARGRRGSRRASNASSIQRASVVLPDYSTLPRAEHSQLDLAVAAAAEDEAAPDLPLAPATLLPGILEPVTEEAEAEEQEEAGEGVERPAPLVVHVLAPIPSL